MQHHKLLGQSHMMGFKDPINAVIVGGSGGIGAAFVDAIRSADPRNAVVATSRRQPPSTASPLMHLDITDEHSITRLVDHLHLTNFRPNLVINCSGVLHTNEFGPERSWRHFDIDVMRKVFDVNTFGVGLLGKHLIPLFDREGRSVFASLSARVGSISDNRLGGWYSYRASKSAQNMFIKGLAIEAARKWRELICVALHPGTVDTALSQPFSSGVPPEKLFTTAVSCQHLSRVIENLTVEDTGRFFAWDGQAIEY